jgi:hypothetical protein
VRGEEWMGDEHWQHEVCGLVQDTFDGRLVEAEQRAARLRKKGIGAQKEAGNADAALRQRFMLRSSSAADMPRSFRGRAPHYAQKEDRGLLRNKRAVRYLWPVFNPSFNILPTFRACRHKITLRILASYDDRKLFGGMRMRTRRHTNPWQIQFYPPLAHLLAVFTVS